LLLQDDAGTESPGEIDTWRVPVLKTIATSGEGIPELYDAIVEHAAHLDDSGLRAERERARLEVELAERLKTTLLEQFLAQIPPSQIENMLRRLVTRETAPAQAVRELIEGNS
ncbi:MAG TPA: hypothetical protein VJZ27_05340, partial [Aggregatilineales bacterium]|nr:hypothetical protein [Aggregatilineales bacterium]